MMYHLVRPVARYVLGYYYRHIDISGLDHIPPGAAVILAANHPTAFIEPCLLACYQPRTLHFLARGDLYKNRLATFVLRALNILPVYRMQDGGYEKLVRNYDTFEECYAALSRRRAIMILAEGRCIHEKKLRPLRKGTARIALGALDRDATLEEVYIVPVGVNFAAADRARSDVSIACGPPIAASEYLHQYRDNEAEGIRNLTARLRAELSPLVVQIPDAYPAVAAETVLAVARSDGSQKDSGHSNSGKQLTAQLTRLTRPLPRPGLPLRYSAILRHFGLRDADLSCPAPPLRPWSIAAVIALLPLIPLWLLAEFIALRGPKTIEFYSPLRFAAIAVGTLLYLPLLFLLPLWAKIYLAVSLVTVRPAIRQLEGVGAWRRGKRLGQVDRELRQELDELRRQLL